jgi:thioredoxin 2
VSKIIACHKCGQTNRVGALPRGTPACGRCKTPLPWLIEADQGSFDQEVRASVPVLVDFWAAWCAPCRQVAPVLEQLARDYAGKLKIVKVDVEREPTLAARFDARSIPLLVVIRDGHEVDRVIGAATRRALEHHLGLRS